MDHPRSRGVYLTRARITITIAGSSPLARGLRRERGAGRALLRIIPARAGFTHSIAYQYQAAEDHPRSRGVYLQVVGGDSTDYGSSPLARGLRDWGASELTARGIIPARAGFTTGPAGRSLRPPDHPRSRGVYH